MLGTRGRRWAHATLAAVAGGALLIGSAAPAAADEATTGVPRSVNNSSVSLLLDGKTVNTSGIALEIKGEKEAVPAFCIDFHTPLGTDQSYTEGTWNESEVKNLAKVQWVLAHSYPNGDSAALLKAAGVTVPAGADSKKLLYFGTQTAIWYFSDNVTLDAWNSEGLGDKDQYAVIKGVYDYLTTHATDQPEPAAQLTVSPAGAAAKVGEKAGPFTVAGPAGDVKVAVTGGSAVDAAGKPVTTTTNGGQFWLTATEAGKVAVKLTAEESVSFGRVFLFSGGKDQHQKLILGSSTGKTVTAGAEATFTSTPATTASSSAPATSTSSASTPPATGSPSESASESPSAAVPATSTSPTSGGALALTGSATGPVIGGGALLLIVGAGLMLMVRRRRTRFTS
ncbi:thioester domain-containing protein [Actinoplanes sp. NPDC020271]|uniref:thioester domain-containing protein n=1 Tax=Actinoplanes sp. NPDC020271 TaxID=3363896 RepID=UPI00379F9822